ncbi:MAG: LON peptidase substrate-binding domain-containing protein [Deltaproteobacteria bacterium]
MDNLLLPLFPLEIVLLPEEPLPMHIFEDRYKEMIGECLKAKEEHSGQQEFGIVLAREDEMRTAGCSAKIVNVTRKYPDGRLDIFTVGVRRFEVLYTDQERSFLRGGVEFFDDDAGADAAEDADAARAIELFREMMQRLRKTSDLPVHFPRPYRHLSFRIASALPLELDFKFQLLILRNESERLRRTIQTLEHLIPQLDRVERLRSKAGGNGHSS